MAWAGSRTYTVQSGMVTGTLTNFPALVVVRDPDFRTVANGGMIQTGHDFAFFMDAAGVPGSITDFEREYHDPVNGDIAYWVRVPSMFDGAKVHLQFGDGSIGASLENKNGVWDSNFKLVDHLKDGTTLIPFDSVLPNPATGTLVNGTGPAPGRVRSGAFIDEDLVQSINYGAPAKLDLTTDLTYSCWVKPYANMTDAYCGLMVKTRNVPGNYAWNSLMLKSNMKLFMGICQTAGGGDVRYDGTGATTLTPLLWYYISMTFTTSFGLRGYVNGLLDGSVASTTVGRSTTGCDLHVGQDATNVPRRFNGWVDEIRVSNVARSIDWERASYLNQYTPRVFWGVNVTITQTGREQYRNNSATTLAANIASTATEFTVAAGSELPPRGAFRTRIGSELALVRTITGNVCSDVIRGAENTMPAAHTAGDAVIHDITAMSLRALPIPGRPALNRPQVAAESMFTPLNLGTAVITSDDAGVVITAPGKGTGYNLIGMFQPVPEPPYMVTASFQFVGMHKNYIGFGMHWRDYNNPLATFDCIAITGEMCELSQRKANSQTSYNSGYQFMRHYGWVKWMRLSDDGTNRKCWFSPDGQYWIELHSVARGDFFIPDFIGWQVYNENTAGTAYGVIGRLLTWDVVVP